MAIRTQAIDTDFSKNLRTWSRDLAALRQNDLLSESALLSFLRDRGIGVSGVLKGEPGVLHRQGFLSADGRRGKELLFHPFRLHVLERALSVGDHITPERAKQWNTTAELAILLEPIYWPEITGHVRYSLGERDHSARFTRLLPAVVGVENHGQSSARSRRNSTRRASSGLLSRNRATRCRSSNVNRRTPVLP